METGLRPLIEDNELQPPNPNEMLDDIGPQEDSTPITAVDYQQPVYMPMVDNRSKDIFADIDKQTLVIMFVIFILGFFMGKTMQPVILRPT